MNLLELFIIFLVTLVVFKPEDLPTLAKSLGQHIAKIRALINSFSQPVTPELELQKNLLRAKQSEEQHDRLD